MMGRSCSDRALETVDLPVAIPPVSPTIRMFFFWKIIPANSHPNFQSPNPARSPISSFSGTANIKDVCYCFAWYVNPRTFLDFLNEILEHVSSKFPLNYNDSVQS
jgi:hypothetical protein